MQALLASPMFTNRWRWNANRALAILRFAGGRRVPMPIQRMRAEDLMAAVFPEQVACQDNRSGPITPPDHPLVNETINNCLSEAMDFDGLLAIVARVERGDIRTVAVDTPQPSPMSHEILNANPYAFLDDAPLEERRSQAVYARRATEPGTSSSRKRKRRPRPRSSTAVTSSMPLANASSNARSPTLRTSPRIGTAARLKF